MSTDEKTEAKREGSSFPLILGVGLVAYYFFSRTGSKPLPVAAAAVDPTAPKLISTDLITSQNYTSGAGNTVPLEQKKPELTITAAGPVKTAELDALAARTNPEGIVVPHIPPMTGPLMPALGIPKNN